jgi:D-ornithine 4,5-aminomutase subunit alpha
LKSRPDDFVSRRAHLAGLDDDALEQRFWDLAGRVVEPLLELASTHTSPAIERSILGRLGVPSHEARAVVEGCLARGLLGHGAGHVVVRAARAAGLLPRTAASELAAGRLWETVEGVLTRGPK